MLDDLVTNLSGASDRKGAVLVMIGLLHSAIGKTLLVQEGNSPAQAVLNLWK
ncbi:MAG TPA: hypothetical protein PKE46_05980 [Micropruina sp.]|nr:hypothetical protein [Micropruina sp.]HMR21670.1 hypothetical protein [Micropruina sp.]